jgi:Mg-chelatase subunit ChlD
MVHLSGVPAVQILNHSITQPTLLGRFFGVESQQLQASAVSFVRRRHIVIIQDVSGSMQIDNRIGEARGALRTLVDHMALNPMPGDSMGLISYDDHLRLNDQLALMTNDRVRHLRNLIGGMTPLNYTAPHLGIDAARLQFEANPDELADRVAILVSDGAPYPPENIPLAHEARDRLCNPALNIQLSTILVDVGGTDQPEPCNGGYRYTDTAPDEIRDVLFTILSRQQVLLVD